MGTRAYKYVIRAPVSNRELIVEQMKAAHHYRNKLVEIERMRRQAQRALLSSATPVAEAEASLASILHDLEEAVKEIKAYKQNKRAGKVPEELRTKVSMLRVRRRDALVAHRQARLASKETQKTEAMTVDALAADQRKAARASCGVYWGTYLLVESADQQARKDTPLYDGGEPSDPRFTPWTGEGQIGVQLQHGMSVGELYEPNTLVQLIPHERITVKGPATSKRAARRQYCHLRMRIQSNEARDPIWAEWPMVMHRPLPPDGRVKRVIVQRRRVGAHEEWSVVFSCEADYRRIDNARDGVVGLDIGWRMRPDGQIRVGAWAGSDGQRGEVLLPPRLITAMSKPDELRSVRDKAFDRARAELKQWIQQAPYVPTWMRERAQWVDRWKSPGRLAGIVRTWAGLRFEGDREIYDRMEAWRYHDFHLWNWECHQRETSKRWLKDFYRVVARDLARRYERLVIEEFDLRPLARRPMVEDHDPTHRLTNATRHLVAPSMLRECAMQAFSTVEQVDATNTTRACRHCGTINSWNAAEEVTHQCVSCGAVWDQDDNAADNIRMRSGTGKVVGGERPTERGGSWARRKAAAKNAA